MRYSPGDIKSNPRFVLLDELNYDDIVDFTSKYIRKRNLSMIFLYVFLVGTFLLMIGALVYGMVDHHREFGSIMKQYLYGLILSFSAMIPIHEIIHGIIYVVLGARKVRFGAEFKQFAFYAVADEFVTGRTGFYILAVGPFLITSVLCLLGFILVSGVASYTYISILFFHATMCIGDFALMSYYDTHKDKNIYTFDDIKNRVSYFYYLND
jgi:uncharacterized RmlC-like cupin family protein